MRKQGKITGYSGSASDFRNDFDYSIWDDENLETEIKLMRVNWDSSYANAVNWTSEEHRDGWFNQSHPGEIIIPPTGYNIRNLFRFSESQGKYSGSLNVELPSESISMFNYLVVTHKYPQPVPGPEPRETKHFFFIRAVNNVAPNTSEILLQMDVWTAYKFIIGINGVLLSQGHYPLAITNSSDFLANPLETEVDLTAVEDTLPSVKKMVSHTGLVSFQKNSPRVCIATTADLSQVEGLWVGETPETAPAAKWWDEKSAIGWDGAAPTPVASPTQASGNLPTGFNVFSVSPEDYGNFINFFRERVPQFIKTIQAVYVLDSVLVEESEPFDVYGFSVKNVVPQDTAQLLESVKLEESMFGYDPKYASFAKMYTGQFSEVVISASGRDVTVSVEELAGDIGFYARASSAFPFLKLEAFIDGIGGSGSENFVVKPWGELDAEVFSGQNANTTFVLDVPTYGVFLSPAEEAGITSGSKQYVAEENVEHAEDVATRDLDTYNLINAEAVQLENYLGWNQNVHDLYTATVKNALDLLNAEQRAWVSNETTIRSLDTDKEVSDNEADLMRGIEEDILIPNKLSNSLSSINANETAALSESSTAELIAADESSDIFDLDEALSGINEEIREDQIMLNHMSSNFSIAQNDQISELNGTEVEKMELFNVWAATIGLGLDVGAASIAMTRQTASMMVSTGAGTMVGGVGASMAEKSAGAISAGVGAVAGAVTGVAAAAINAVAYVSEIELMSDQIQFNTDRSAMNSLISGAWSFGGLTLSPDRYGLTGGDTYTRDVGPSLARAVHEVSKFYSEQQRDLNLTVAESLNDLVVSQDLLTRTTSKGIRDRARDIYPVQRTNVSNIATVNRNIATISSADEDGLSFLRHALKKSSANTTNVAGHLNADLVFDEASYEAGRISDYNIDIYERNYNLAEERIDSTRDHKIDAQNYRTWNVEDDISETARISRLGNELALAESVATPTSPNGAFNGDGFSDQFGARGIQVRINRISKADERTVGEAFRIQGYKMNDFYIPTPELGVMTEFTYWKVREIWTDAGQLNDANEQTFINIFKNGVFLWNTPENVKKVYLENMPKETTP